MVASWWIVAFLSSVICCLLLSDTTVHWVSHVQFVKADRVTTTSLIYLGSKFRQDVNE